MRSCSHGFLTCEGSILSAPFIGNPGHALNRLSETVGGFEWRGPSDTFDNYFKNAGLDLTNRRISKYLEPLCSASGLASSFKSAQRRHSYRTGSTRCSCPLEPATMPGRVVCQWDKDDCADLKIVKVDILGLGMMAALKDTINVIRDHHGEEIDLAHLPEDLTDVYDVIRKADTIGMFQIESRAQMASLPRNNPTRFYDLCNSSCAHSVWPDHRTDELSLSKSQRGQGIGHLPSPIAYPDLGTHIRGSAVSGTVTQDGDDVCWFHWWRSRRAAPRSRSQTFQAEDDRDRDSFTCRHYAERN